MDSTPHFRRQPSSILPYISKSLPVYQYHPSRSESQLRSTDTPRSIGLYSSPMLGSALEEPAVIGPASHIQSSPAPNHWSNSHLQLQHTVGADQSVSGVDASEEYDSFPPYQNTVTAPYTHDIYSTQTAEVPILPASPYLSSSASQRSSFSSAPASEIYTQPGSISSYTPSIKMEGDHSDFGTSNETMIMGSPPDMNHNLLTSNNSYPGTLDATFYQDQANLGWSKVEYTTSQDLPSISTLPIPLYDRRSESQERPSSVSLDRRRGPSTVVRTRTPRKLTTKEDANFQCHVKGCGKLFGRSYNFKAHMETHDTGREYPFPCQLKDCNKKFVRKTDLQRHHQSVHMKQRNHRCDYCNRLFARKDTLRRHMADGCSKRFDIETVDFRPQLYSPNPMSSRSLDSRDTETPLRLPAYRSSEGYSPPPTGPSTVSHDHPSLSSVSGQYLQRHDYSGADTHRESIWST